MIWPFTYFERRSFMLKNPGVDESIRQDPRYEKAMREFGNEMRGKPCEWPYCKESKGNQIHHGYAPLWANIGLTREEQIISASDQRQYFWLCRKHHLMAHAGDFARRVITNLREVWAGMKTTVRIEPLKAAPLKAIVLPWQEVHYYTVTSLAPVWNRSHTHTLTPPIGFKSDLYTDAPNLPDPRPAVYHDYAYSTHAWDDKTPMTIQEANDLFLLLGQNSTSFWTRFWIGDYFDAVQICGQSFWDANQKCRLT